jgi:Cu(I)/Ag(I) efflux system membrane fusion protein
MDIYSPDLETAQQELLFLLKNDAENAGLIHAAKQKLLLLGMSDDQLTKVIDSGKPTSTVTVYSNYSGHLHEAGNTMPSGAGKKEKTDAGAPMEELPVKEGMYVEQGQNIFQLFNTDNIWVILNIFPELQGIVKVGNPVNIIPETSPAISLNGKIDFIESVYRPDNKTLTARVYLKNPMGMMPVGSQIRARIFTGNKISTWLPKDAVLFLGMDKVVFLKTNGGFHAHKVVTGQVDKDQIQIISGLKQTDSVAANGQYLADSESFIKIKQ